MRWRALILAAGRGTRMNSDLAKVLHKVRGKSLLEHVLETASRLPLDRMAVIIGHQHERVRAEHSAWNVEFVLQQPQRGTGHAVQQAEPFLRGTDGSTLVLYGDVPLLRLCTLLELMEEHRHARNAATVLTARLADPSGYGRIVRGDRGELVAIVEDRDLAPEDRTIDEINSGIYAFETPLLLAALHGLTDDNRQGELYLTDTVRQIRDQGGRVGTYTLADPLEISGINTIEQLAAAESLLAGRKAARSEDCPVCALANAESGFPILAKRPHALLAVSARPYNSGQLTVHPIRHMIRHAELGDAERTEFWRLGQIAAEAVRELYGPQGMTIGFREGKPGEHLGLEIVPRWVGDTNFMPILAQRKLLPESLDETYRRAREFLARRGWL